MFPIDDKHGSTDQHFNKFEDTRNWMDSWLNKEQDVLTSDSHLPSNMAEGFRKRWAILNYLLKPLMPLRHEARPQNLDFEGAF